MGPITLSLIWWNAWAGAPVRMFAPPYMREAMRAAANWRHRMVIDSYYGPRPTPPRCGYHRRWR
jgi:hypothetical protein